MIISKKGGGLTERETITHIFMREKSYRMNSGLSTKNSMMPRRRIFKNAHISTKRRNRAKNNANSGTNKTAIIMMIMNNMNTTRKSSTRYMIGSSI